MKPTNSEKEPAPPTEGEYRSPWAYIITLYLPFGILDGGLKGALPFTLFKLLDFSNQAIGLLSGLGLVASFRFLFAPWLDGATTKRRLALTTLLVTCVLSLGAAGVVYARLDETVFAWAMVAILFWMAITSAAHETAADGYYIRALDPRRQAEFIGIKTAAIRLGHIFSLMALLLMATKIAAHFGAVDMASEDKTGFHIGFSSAYAFAAVLMLLFFIWNKWMVPQIPQDEPVRHARFALGEVLREYWAQPRALLIIAMILLYRFGEGFLIMKHPFYLDPLEDGGLASEASDMAYYAALTDTPWMIIGGVLGGYMIKWWGLKRTFVPLVLCMNLPNLFYVWLAWAQPMQQIQVLGETLNVGLLFGSSIESLGYGLSFSGMFYFMHITATEAGRNKTSILAISFALMNAGWVIPGMLSGYVQAAVGYVGVFLISSTVGLVVLLIVPFMPMPRAESRERAAT